MQTRLDIAQNARLPNEMNRFIFLLPLLLQISASRAKVFDYYWRDYFGSIPHDAFPGGTSTNGQSLYLAQAFRPGGVFVSSLHPGDTSITITGGAALKSDLDVKVLCTKSPRKFSWLRTTHKMLNTDAIGKHLVPGGAQHGKTLHIGRVWRQGEVLIGVIYEHGVANNVLYFVQDKRVFNTKEYEALIYEDDGDDDIFQGMDARTNTC